MNPDDWAVAYIIAAGVAVAVAGHYLMLAAGAY
jgi:hypothetical protein